VSSLARDLLAEYRRPWKLASLAAGIALLIAGSFYFEAPDWDIPISLIMAVLAYLTAPWSLRVILERRWRWWPLMLFFTWFTVDGCYAIYWHFKNPIVLPLMRDANFLASLSLYGLCGILWLYRGSLGELRSDALARIGRAHLRWLRRARIPLYVLLDAAGLACFVLVGILSLGVLMAGMFRLESPIVAFARLVLAAAAVCSSYFVLIAHVFLQTNLLRKALGLIAAVALPIAGFALWIGLARLMKIQPDQSGKIVAMLVAMVLFQTLAAWRAHRLLARLAPRRVDSRAAPSRWYGGYVFGTLVFILVVADALALFGSDLMLFGSIHLLRIVLAPLFEPIAATFVSVMQLDYRAELAIPLLVLAGLFGPWSRRRIA
jgi:hypothetical protein